MRKELYSVWVGGIEVNDHLIDYKSAFELAHSYGVVGYDDVHIALASLEDEDCDLTSDCEEMGFE
tara:strand:- start:230 stop:424 length:195 start_codon:yes stop_codon:yes gene_type:complete